MDEQLKDTTAAESSADSPSATELADGALDDIAGGWCDAPVTGEDVLIWADGKPH